MLDAPEGHRTAGLVATHAGAECVLRLISPSLGAGYLSLTLERGFRNVALVDITCLIHLLIDNDIVIEIYPLVPFRWVVPVRNPLVRAGT